MKLKKKHLKHRQISPFEIECNDECISIGMDGLFIYKKLFNYMHTDPYNNMDWYTHDNIHQRVEDIIEPHMMTIMDIVFNETREYRW